MHVVLGLPSYYFFINFFDLVFPGPISIRIDIWWEQVLLDVSTDNLETILTCSTWSEDVHVVWGNPAIIFFFNVLLFST